MGLRYIPPGKKSYKKPLHGETVTHEVQHDAVDSHTVAEKTGEVAPVIEATSIEVDSHDVTPMPQPTVEPKVVHEAVSNDTSSVGNKRKK